MSHTHQSEIDKLTTDAQVRSFEGLCCPFCGVADLFVHPPGTQHWTGHRTWWTVGCDSRACNSCWKLDADTYESARGKILRAQPK